MCDVEEGGYTRPKVSHRTCRWQKPTKTWKHMKTTSESCSCLHNFSPFARCFFETPSSPGFKEPLWRVPCFHLPATHRPNRQQKHKDSEKHPKKYQKNTSQILRSYFHQSTSWISNTYQTHFRSHDLLAKEPWWDPSGLRTDFSGASAIHYHPDWLIIQRYSNTKHVVGGFVYIISKNFQVAMYSSLSDQPVKLCLQETQLWPRPGRHWTYARLRLGSNHSHNIIQMCEQTYFCPTWKGAKRCKNIKQHYFQYITTYPHLLDPSKVGNSSQVWPSPSVQAGPPPKVRST